MRDPDDEIGKAMAKALSAKVQRREPAAAGGEAMTGKAWQPPRCGRRGCGNPADVSKHDFDAEQYSVAKGIVRPGRKWYCKANNYQCAKIETERAHGRRGRFKESPTEAPPEPPISIQRAEGVGYDDI